MTDAQRQQAYLRLISGAQRGGAATVLRGLLCAATVPYRGFMAARRGYYHFAATRAGIPVISVGNLTVGGTGKTPLVSFIAQRLAAMNRRPLIVSRGYKRPADAPGDEAAAMRAELPAGAVHVESPDRAAGIARAIDEARRAGRAAPDVAILDDGFQHLRLRRNLDIVAVDATQPFGFGHLLPRGLLREPLSALRRADAVVVTRCDQVTGEELARVAGRVQAYLKPGAPLLRAAHEPVALRLAGGGSEAVAGLRGAKVFAFCGLGNPAAFYRTLAQVGAQVVGTRDYPDHHAYAAGDVAEIAAAAKAAGAARVVTTTKDMVKVARLVTGAAAAKSTVGQADRGTQEERHISWAALAVELRFREGEAALDELLRKATAGDVEGSR